MNLGTMYLFYAGVVLYCICCAGGIQNINSLTRSKNGCDIVVNLLVLAMASEKFKSRCKELSNAFLRFLLSFQRRPKASNMKLMRKRGESIDSFIIREALKKIFQNWQLCMLRPGVKTYWTSENSYLQIVSFTPGLNMQSCQFGISSSVASRIKKNRLILPSSALVSY